MNDKKIIQDYINNFRRHLSGNLKPGLGISVNVYPAEEEGAVLEFNFGNNFQNLDNYLDTYKTVNDALKNVNQNMFGGNLDAFRFGGTNISLEDGRIILIKGENDPSQWSDTSSGTDVSTIVNTAMKASK